MINQDISFPNKIKFHGNRIEINIEDFISNIININNVDYVPYLLDNTNPYKHGGNSYILKLAEAQNIDFDNNGYPDTPDLIIKICKTKKRKIGEDNPRSAKFKNEINALYNCNTLLNIIPIYHFGIAWIYLNNKKTRIPHYYYTMDYAENDLPSFLEKNNISLIERVEMCLEISESLKQLYSFGYYHRDIKPENILFVNDRWMISDLGLVDHRDNNFEMDIKGQWIGPRGWMSPESMNKFLTESKPWNFLYDFKIDHKSDIFQLGKVFWYILQGNSPEGSIRRNDFIWKNEQLYQNIRTMINHNKFRRYEHISYIIENFKRLWKKISIEKDEYLV